MEDGQLRDIYIFGASGWAKEVYWLITEINRVTPTWRVKAFVDLKEAAPIFGVPVISQDGVTLARGCAVAVACGTPRLRRRIVSDLQQRPDLEFPALVHPSVLVGTDSTVGKGSVIGAHSIMTCDVHVGSFVIINLDCTIGHTTRIGNFCTISPGVHVSGNVLLGEEVFLGTGACIIEGRTVGAAAVVGSGAVVIDDIPPGVLAVGVPAQLKDRYKK